MIFHRVILPILYYFLRLHILFTAANIFLTNEGNCLKLGDFGSAVQIKAHTTMPGELQGFVGTQGLYFNY